MREFLQFPVEASAHAAQIDRMTILTHWLMAILFVGWGAYFIFALIVVFAIPAWASRVEAFPQESQATVVRIVAQQFQWNVHYPGADGQFGRTDPKLVSSENALGLD